MDVKGCSIDAARLISVVDCWCLLFASRNGGSFSCFIVIWVRLWPVCATRYGTPSNNESMTLATSPQDYEGNIVDDYNDAFLPVNWQQQLTNALQQSWHLQIQSIATQRTRRKLPRRCQPNAVLLLSFVRHGNQPTTGRALFDDNSVQMNTPTSGSIGTTSTACSIYTSSVSMCPNYKHCQLYLHI